MSHAISGGVYDTFGLSCFFHTERSISCESHDYEVMSMYELSAVELALSNLKAIPTGVRRGFLD